MDGHYEIQFFEDPLSTVDLTGQVLSDGWTRLGAADSSVRFTFPRSEVLRQKLVLKKYHFELIQCNCSRPFPFLYRTDRDRFFFLFVLEAEIGFSTENGAGIITAKKNSFYPSHNSPGTYLAKIPANSTFRALVVSLDPRWALDIVRPYPELKEALTEMLTSERPFSIMPRCRIDGTLKETLSALFEIDGPNRAIIKLQLREKIAVALSHYNQKLLETGWVAVYRIRLFMEKHYRGPLDMKGLAEMESMTEASFQKKFKLIYTITPYDYILKLRMTEAFRLISREGMAMKDVYLLVGYNDLGNFRKAYKEFRRRVTAGERP